jgi:hypothetical protein
MENAMCQTNKLLKVSVFAITAVIITCTSAASTTWITTEKDKDLLTGESYTFVRVASGLSGSNRRYMDVLKLGEGFSMRFVVPQPTNTVTTLWAPGFATSRSARGLGQTVTWMVEGKAQHPEDPKLSTRKRHMGVTDYEASWQIGCEAFRDLLTGKTLRIVTPEFNGEFDLSGLAQHLEKVFGLSAASLLKGRQAPCTASAPPAPKLPSLTPPERR